MNGIWGRGVHTHTNTSSHQGGGNALVGNKTITEDTTTDGITEDTTRWYYRGHHRWWSIIYTNDEHVRFPFQINLIGCRSLPLPLKGSPPTSNLFTSFFFCISKSHKNIRPLNQTPTQKFRPTVAAPPLHTIETGVFFQTYPPKTCFDCEFQHGTF